MDLDEITYQIGLTLIDGIGDVLAKNLVAYCGGAEEVFKTKKSHLEKIPGIGGTLATVISHSQSVLNRAEKERRFIEENKIEALFYTHSKYPQRLKNCHDSPVMLYYKGQADLNKDKVIAVVGTRNPTEYGKDLTQQLIEELKESGALIVSGLAYGIDIAAHKSAYSCQLETVGVLAHGLDRIYPAVHTSFSEKMVTAGGLLTEYISETNPDRENFPKRNRIVAGMCDALVVIESKRDGGSLITATIANSYHKDVFAFPGRVGDSASEGCNGLIKSNRAALIENAADLMYQMRWDVKPEKKTSRQIPLLLSLSEEEQKIAEVLNSGEQMHLDELCYATQWNVSKVSTILLQMEFSNVVKSLPGKMYKIMN